MGIDLLAPWFLAGLLATAIPVVLHLIRRRQSRLLPIGTLRFLRQIPARTIRRRQLEEYLLLAARILLFALLALAATRPVLVDASAAGGSTAMAIVLDDSWSMQYRVEGIPRFSAAVAATAGVLQSLEPGDRTAVVLASTPARGVLSTDIPGTIRQIRADRPSSLAPDLLAATNTALDLLRRAREPNRELVLVTDFQARAVAPLVSSLKAEPGDSTIRVLAIDVGARKPANLSVVSVTAGSGAVVAGETVPVVAEVRNSGPATATSRVSLFLGDSRVAETSVKVGPGETRSVTFTAATRSPGTEGGRVRLEGDGLPTDDVRVFALPVTGRIPVLLVDGDPSPLPYQDEAFFLRAALAPEELGAKAVPPSSIAMKTIPVAQLEKEDLTTYRVLILANVADVGPREAQALRTFVTGGGGLLLFTGNRLRPDDLNRDLGTDPKSGLLPAVLSAPEELSDDPKSWLSVGQVDTGNPLFAGLDPETLKDAYRISARRAMGADAGSAGGRVVASFANGVPFLVEKEAGRGRVLLVNTSADTGWGNFPLRPLFLPFLHRAVRYLAGNSKSFNRHLLGEMVGIPPPPSSAPPVEVTDPAGEVTRPVQEDVSTGNVLYGPLLKAGLYRVKGSGRGTYLFAANPDPAEGDLLKADPKELRDEFGPDRFRLLRAGTGLVSELRRTRKGRPLWGYLLAAALAVFLFEAFFANRVARARAEPAEPPAKEGEGRREGEE